MADNPARRVEMPLARRPHAVASTDGRVESWQTDGVRPAVAVWTTAQIAAFLEHVQDDPLYAFWWLVALRGLRRGEAAGLRWQDLDLERRQLTVVNQRTTVGYQIVEGPPKSAASRRTIALDVCGNVFGRQPGNESRHHPLAGWSGAGGGRLVPWQRGRAPGALARPWMIGSKLCRGGRR